MPTYEYLCKSCGERLEVQQSFTDDALTECPRCEGPLRKVFGNVGITFKGSGFYKTDSRSGSKSSSGTSSSSREPASGSGSDSSSSSGGSESSSPASSESSSSGSGDKTATTSPAT
ncbi:MAG TPA: FmdB family zinc ribbon protein [Acidimicrobiales bacterium]